MTSPRSLIALALCLTAAPAALAAEGRSRRREGTSEDAEHARLQRELDFTRSMLRRLLQQQRDQAELLLKLLDRRDRGGAAPTEPPSLPEAPEPTVREPEPREAAPTRPERGNPGERPRLSGSGVLTGKVALQGEGSLAEAVVYVVDVRGRPARNSVLTIRQVNKQFVPRTAVVPRGTRLEIPNEDSIFHNAFSLSPGNSFDLGTYRAGDQPGAVMLNTPGVVKIFCNIHSQMAASVLVVPSTLFAQVKPDGTFRLSGVPPGKHRIAAWIPNGELVTREVEVTPGDNAPLGFALSGRAGQAHTNKFGQPYGSYAE